MNFGYTVQKLIARGYAGSAAFEKAMRDLDEKFRLDAQRTKKVEEAISFPALARHILYMALGRAEEKRKGTTAHLKPRWADLAHMYHSFRQRLVDEFFLDKEIDNQDLRRMCSFDTYRQGTGGNTFYSSLALFVVDLIECGEFVSEFVNFALPKSDWELVAAVSRYLLEQHANTWVAKAAELAISVERSSQHAAPIHSEIQFKFAYVQSKLDDLRKFHEGFRSHYSDLGVHFICYRPRKSDPAELMKTFLAVMPPEAHDEGSKSFNFVHIYQAPETIKQQIALGKVLPLHEGLYLVGGQTEMQEPRPSRPVPFRTLKVISLAWRSIEVFDHLLSGLVMSANNQGYHLTSRIVLRATPLHHSSQVELGAVGLKDLEKDIQEDMKKEIGYLERQQASDDEFLKYELQRSEKEMATTARNLAKRIIDGTNNGPAEWDLAGSMSSTRPKGSRLTKASIVAGLDDKFGSYGNASYKDMFGRDFDFWSSVRFGVLTRKT
jgi:hypothetical protein